MLGVGSNQTTVDATALAISQIFNNYLIADFDGSGAVNGSDFLTWQSNVGSGTTFAEGDADNDGDVDGDDLDLWEANSGGSDRYALAVDRVMEVY